MIAMHTSLTWLMLKLIISTVRCLIDNEFYNKYYNVHNVHILTMLNLIISTVRCLIDNGFYIMYIWFYIP